MNLAHPGGTTSSVRCVAVADSIRSSALCRRRVKMPSFGSRYSAKSSPPSSRLARCYQSPDGSVSGLQPTAKASSF